MPWTSFKTKEKVTISYACSVFDFVFNQIDDYIFAFKVEKVFQVDFYSYSTHLNENPKKVPLYKVII